MMQASSIIGMQVTVTDPDDSTKTKTGIVSEAIMNGEEAGILIDDVEYPLDLIKSVKKPSSNPTGT
jgi:flagellar hook assembly protein FlgD